MMRTSGKAIFLSTFDQRSQFVTAVLEEVLDDTTASRRLELVRLDRWSCHKLTQELTRLLHRASFAVFDITPTRKGEDFCWNPNVMFELGMAEELAIPTFKLCDQAFFDATTLPFNIKDMPITCYERSDDGKVNLQAKFRSWLAKAFDKNFGVARRYEQNLDLSHTLRHVFQSSLQWTGASAPAFRQLLTRLASRLEHHATEMQRFILNPEPDDFEFKPDHRPAAIQNLFVSMMDSLDSGDQYYTKSTLEFWKSFHEDGEKFLRSCGRAADRGVHIRRLLIVPDNLNEDEETIVNAHLRESRDYDCFELLILRVPRAQATPPSTGHVGICLRAELGVTTAFLPVYDSSGGRQKVVSIMVREDAECAARQFDDDWAEALTLQSTG